MDGACGFEGCNKPLNCRGYCQGHYVQAKEGRPLSPLRQDVTGLSLVDRLAAKSEPDGACLIWTGAPTRAGYGVTRVGGRGGQREMVHRLAWELENGPIPDGEVIDHACGKRLCIRVAHLRVVSRKENNQHRTRMDARNSSGYRGVCFDKRAGNWKAYCGLDSRLVNLGGYATPEEAGRSRQSVQG